MSRTTFLLAVVVLVVCGLVCAHSGASNAAANSVNNKHQCSRPLSRKVRNFVEAEIFSKLTIKPNELPNNCQLNPKYDLYLDQERHKVEYSRSEWTCSYCRKSFKNEKYLDRHMDNKHQHRLAVSSLPFSWLVQNMI
jgi:hypothetical protein